MTKEGITYGKNLQFNWLVILLLLPLTFAFCLHMHFNGLYGQEPHASYRYMLSIYGFFAGGPSPVSMDHPVMFPLLGAIATLFVPSLFALQFIGLASAGFAYLYCCKILNRLYPEGSQRQRFALLLLFFSPFFLRAALTGFADITCVAFLLAAHYQLLKWQDKKRNKNLLLALGLGILAIQTRYSAVYLLLPLFPPVVSACRKSLSVFLIILFVLVFAFIPTIFIKGNDGLDIVLHPWLRDWSIFHYFQSAFGEYQGTGQWRLPNLLHALSVFLHPGYCLIGILLIAFCVRQGTRIPRSWMMAAALFLLFIAGLPVQDLRLLLPVFPLFLIATYPAYESIVYRLKKRNERVLAYIVALAVQWSLLYRVIQPVYEYQQEEWHIAQELKKMEPATLHTFAIDGALRTYQVPQQVVNMWSQPVTNYMNGDFVLFNRNRFMQYYPTSAPVEEFRRLRKEGRLMFIVSYPNGWELYRLNS